MAGLDLGKILLGKEQAKRNLLDLTHDVTTTMDWGEVQPLMCREMVPNSDLTVDIDSFVRLMPMPIPTFGRASYKTFHTFVPIQEIYDAFESLMSKKPFTHGGIVYVPSTVPYINQTALTLQVLKYALVSAYKVVDNATSGKKDLTFMTSASTLRTATNAFKALSIVTSNIYSSDLVFNEAYSATNRVTPDAADFKYEITAGSDTYLLCFRLDPARKRLRKVLIGLGYQLQLMNSSQVTKVSILPLIAYYKAYFDIFAPQRDITWKQTHAYFLMENIEQYNSVDIASAYITQSTATLRGYWNDFIDEVMDAWYTDNTDYFSAHITTPTISPANSWQTTPVAGSALQAVSQGVNSHAGVNNLISQSALNVMKKMYYWANKNTIIGGKVAEYMRVHFGSDVLDDRKSNFIGKNNINIQISDLYSQSETSEGKLGDFAGKGVGFGSSNEMHFKSDVYGYWITLGAIVPDSTYFQGLDPNTLHVYPEQFFTPAYDAVGFQVTPKACFVGDSSTESVLSQTTYNNSASAGFIPRYSEYKVAQNVLNGDISLGSLKDAMLPYTMDKVVTDNRVLVGGTNGNNFTDYRFSSYRDAVPAGSPEWRYIGKYGWLSNFNRIFYANQENEELSYLGRNDQFIVHNVINAKLVAPMLQISDSFETESNEDSIAVQKQ